MPISEVNKEDNLIGMKRFEDKFFDLAVIDPPYGIKQDGRNNHTRGKKTKFGGKMAKNGSIIPAKDYKKNEKYDCSHPSKEYFKELLRVSKNQIIFGANHFISMIPYNSPCWLVWDKLNGDCDFADCELAWTSFITATRKFSFKWNGMLQGDMKNKQERIHPNQKPLQLYEWIFKNYAKPGDNIIDTHLGSQSSRIVAYKMGFDFWGWENDEHYFNEGNKRFNSETYEPLFFQKQYIQTSII